MSTPFYDVDIKRKNMSISLSRKSATRWQKYATIVNVMFEQLIILIAILFLELLLVHKAWRIPV